MYRRTKIALAVIGIAAAGAGYWWGRAVPFAEQWPVYDGLRQTASIVFGITGAWAAIVYPGTLQTIVKRRGTATKEEEGSVNHLLTPLLLSMTVVALVMTAGFVAPLVRRAGLLSDYALIVRGVSFASLGLLSLIELVAVLYLLVPFDRAKSDVEELADRERALRSIRGPSAGRTQDPEDDEDD